MCDGRVIGTTLHGVDIFCSGTGGSPDPHGRWPLRGGCKHPATQRPLYSPQQPNTSTLLRFGAHAFESFGGQAGAILVNNHNITLNHPRLLTTYPFKQPQHFNTPTLQHIHPHCCEVPLAHYPSHMTTLTPRTFIINSLPASQIYPLYSLNTTTPQHINTFTPIAAKSP